jgi:putative pyrroloquinoline-quinone binding quinoprotein
VLGLLLPPAFAQYGTTGTPDAQPNNYPPALPARRGPGPVLVFERLGEIPLPGPLGATPGFASGGEVVIPVEGGWARVAPEAGATPSIVSSLDPPTPVEWVVSSNGKRRFRTTQEGLVEAEHLTRGRKRWASSWKIIAPNSILAPPLLVGPRLCYAGLDDRVTCVRASNGHRLWAVDLGDRLSRQLSAWPLSGDVSVEGEVLLAVPDDGASVIALDAYDGRRVTTFDLPPTHHFASSALVVSRDRIAIARKGYEDREAAVVLLRLTHPPPAPPGSPAPPASLPYNGRSPARTGPSGR